MLATGGTKGGTVDVGGTVFVGGTVVAGGTVVVGGVVAVEGTVVPVMQEASDGLALQASIAADATAQPARDG